MDREYKIWLARLKNIMIDADLCSLETHLDTKAYREFYDNKLSPIQALREDLGGIENTELREKLCWNKPIILQQVIESIKE